mgnify:FL=1
MMVQLCEKKVLWKEEVRQYDITIDGQPFSFRVNENIKYDDVLFYHETNGAFPYWATFNGESEDKIQREVHRLWNDGYFKHY